MTAAQLIVPPICPDDPSSFANSHEIKTVSLNLELAVDFKNKTLSGFVLLNLKAVTDGVSTLVLDSSFINIKNVVLVEFEESDLEVFPFSLRIIVYRVSKARLPWLASRDKT
jgi:hypothetical protein